MNKIQTKESLFLIGEHFYALESLILENEGEITDQIDEWLAEYQAKEEDKIDAYCYLIGKFDEISEEASRLASRATAYKNRVKNLKYRLKTYMELRGRDKLETSRFTILVVPNGGKQPVCLNEGISAEELPHQFVRISKEPDMDGLRNALLGGDDEAGRFATIQPRGTHLRIK